MGVRGWPHALGWDEFQEVDTRPEGAEGDAWTHSGVTFSYDRVVQDGTLWRLRDLTVRVTLRNDSWVVESHSSGPLLSHEQGHHDLAGLIAHEAYREMMAARELASDLDDEVASIFDRKASKLDRLNRRYDAETSHSENADEQRRWKDLISECIANDYRGLPDP